MTDLHGTKEILKSLEQFCNDREDASFAAEDGGVDPVVECAIRDTLDLFRHELRRIESRLEPPTSVLGEPSM